MKTTINGREIKLFGRQEIAMVFTQKVNEYLLQGFYFNLAESSRGHQGEELGAYLTKDGGKTVYFIFADKEYGNYDGADKMVIYVKKYENVEGRTCWMKEGEEVWKKTFYQLENNHRCYQEVYVESHDEYEIIKNIQSERWNQRHNLPNEKELPTSTRRIAVDILRKKKGYKTILVKDVIKVVRRRVDNALIAYVKNSTVFLTK